MEDPKRIIGPYFVLLMAVLLILLIVFTPEQLESLTVGWQLILLVVIAGALGATIHASTSFGDHVGRGDFEEAWKWWYYFRPLIGAAIAFVLVATFRSLLSVDTSDTGTVSNQQEYYVLGCLALAGLGGMFSRQATSWLGQIFQNIFQLAGEKNRGTADDETEAKDSDASDREKEATTASRKPAVSSGESKEKECKMDACWRRFALAAIAALISLIVIAVVLLPMSFKAANVTTENGEAWRIVSVSNPTLIVVVIVAAALGGLIHVTTSFAYFAGTGKLDKRWIWWYVLRPFIAASLSLLIYVGVRGAWLTELDYPYQAYLLIGVAFLAGMFSKQTIRWLSGVYDAVFRKFSGLETKRESNT